MDADFSELNALAADLRRVPRTSNRLVKKAIEVTARNIKDDWRQSAERTGLEWYALDIDYDITVKSEAIEAEIGPTIGDSGSFGFVDEGGPSVLSRPQHAARDAVRANEDDFVRGLEIAVFESVAEEVTNAG